MGANGMMPSESFSQNHASEITLKAGGSHAGKRDCRMSRVRSCVSLGWSDMPFRAAVSLTMASYLQRLVNLSPPSCLHAGLMSRPAAGKVIACRNRGSGGLTLQHQCLTQWQPPFCV